MFMRDRTNEVAHMSMKEEMTSKLTILCTSWNS